MCGDNEPNEGNDQADDLCETMINACIAAGGVPTGSIGGDGSSDAGVGPGGAGASQGDGLTCNIDCNDPPRPNGITTLPGGGGGGNNGTPGQQN